MRRPPDLRHAAAPAGEARADDKDAVGALRENSLTVVNYADAIDCPYACSIGRRSCPWECIQVVRS